MRLSMFVSVQSKFLGFRPPVALWPALAIAAFGVWASNNSNTPIELKNVPTLVSTAEAVALAPQENDEAAQDDNHARLQAPITIERNERVQRWRVVHPGLVRSKTGATARVAHRHTAKFQCLVDWLDDNGFRIKSMGGIAKRPFAGSLHPIGAALDIDQVRRNHLFHGKRYPEGTNEAASRCGLMHGDRTVWRNHPDYGHFQVAGITRSRFARRQQQEPTTTASTSPTTVSAIQSTSAFAAPEAARRVRFASHAGESAPQAPAVDATAVK